MIEEAPIARCHAAKRAESQRPSLPEGLGHGSQVANQLLLHDSTNSRKFPIREDYAVGNIPFAFGQGASDKSAMEKNELRQRIRARLAELDLSPIEAAKTVPGLERNFIRDFLEGKKQSFSAGKQPLVAAALQWTVADLVGPPPRRSSSSAPKLVMVPLLDRVTAGRLRSPSSQIPIDDVPLLAFADLGRGEFFALSVDGDSMDRYSPEGSIIVVNKAERSLVNGRCYIFSVKGETTYKMWQGGPNPHLAPFSTNPLNKPVFFKPRDLEVIGRVKRTILDL
ncbi:S24 family peptidase [Bradyrhizobium frederickii]|nr:S24 family peptidase [Bradyrhizobium frederickii]